MAFQTKITQLLDAHQIPYRLPPHGQPVFTVDAAAQQRGVIKGEIVKSILLRDKVGHYVMACVLGQARLDPKAVRTYVPWIGNGSISPARRRSRQSPAVCRAPLLRWRCPRACR